MQKRLISFIPFKHVIVSTNLSLDEIVNLFSNSISPQWDVVWQTPPKNHKQLQGIVSREGFSIRPTSYYQGSLTYLAGKFIPDPKGGKIEMYIAGPLPFMLSLSVLAGLCCFLPAISGRNYGVLLIPVVIFFGAMIGLILEADRLDWFVGQMLEKYIVE
jgi:hypothetical protein